MTAISEHLNQSPHQRTVTFGLLFEQTMSRYSDKTKQKHLYSIRSNILQAQSQKPTISNTENIFYMRNMMPRDSFHGEWDMHLFRHWTWISSMNP